MRNVKHNVKTIVRNTAAIPTEVGATALEVAADTTSLVTGVVRNAVPATKRVGNILGKFVYGMFNTDMKPEVAERKYDETSLADLVKSMEAASVRAGQDLVKAWENEEETKASPDKQG
ncbi:MAG: hypothetical protein JAY74_25495 [Candidatus Thiodiazotropha taylori]|nr:hypothetical protein [Candidatus Thiodiazotropha taylori]